MELKLTNFADFGKEITKKDYAVIREEGDGFVLETCVNNYTETYVAKTENACKSHFTRTYGKGAKWEKVKADEKEDKDLFSGQKDEKPDEDKKRGRGRPKKEDKKKPAAKKKSTPKKEESKVEEPQQEEPEKEEVGSFAIEENPSGEKAEEELDLTSFETAPTAVEEEADDIKKELEGKKEVKAAIIPVETKDPSGMVAFKTQATELTNVSKAIVTIESDTENENAREAAKKLNELKKTIDKRRKELNKPLQDNINDNNAEAKKIVAPVDKELDRLKAKIGEYELKKEEERKAELAKAEEEKAKQEKLQQAENARINRIKGGIEKMKNDLNQKVEVARKSETLKKYQEQLTNWKPNKEQYMEFYDEVVEVVDDIKNRIEIRLPIILQLEEAQESGNTLKIAEISELLGEVKAEEKQVAEEKNEAKAENDFEARQQLITLFTQIGVENVADDVERIIQVYGSADNAIAHREDILQSYNVTFQAEEKISENKKSSVKNQRIDFVFEVVDKSQVPLEYMIVDEVAIRKALKSKEVREKLLDPEDDFSIAGIKIEKKTTTVLR